MKSVLISIQPKWCELIASGKKTVEVRKTRPKLETPFKVYIYETNWRDNTYWKNHHNGRLGKVIGDFVCRNIDFLQERDLFEGMDEISNSRIEEYSCLSIDELLQYKGNKEEIYGWHISDLVIYDKPRELSEFKQFVDRSKGQRYHEDMLYLQRPPQSWCYVERSTENAE